MIPIILVALAAIGIGLLLTAIGIYRRLAELTMTLGDLRNLLVDNQAELSQAAKGIERVHDDLTRIVANSSKGAEIVRSFTRLPTR
ncbi:hypothetical protein [Enterovirga rhinocerotis]|uniref:hypothetical protein n=1 Tax=Enterovirga rhinocerotis TaxID=1339210 RepID=UPI00105E0226|nr:hypothetical protein [Enterovirga rhinocerotis]